MTVQEFSDQFDVLYNNITSNQAPGLNEYEKSVFLTKAQDMLVKEYFNSRTDGFGGGFDGSQKRQYDFSSLIRTETLFAINTFKDRVTSAEKLDRRSIVFLFPKNYFLAVNEIISDDRWQYAVMPIDYSQYQTLMLKPYNFPVKKGAWRIITDKKNCNYVHEDSAGNDLGDNIGVADYKILSTWADQKRNLKITIRCFGNTGWQAAWEVSQFTTDYDYQMIFPLPDSEECNYTRIVCDAGWGSNKKTYEVEFSIYFDRNKWDDELIINTIRDGFQQLKEKYDTTEDLDWNTADNDLIKSCNRVDGMVLAEAPSKFTTFWYVESDPQHQGRTFTTSVVSIPMAEVIGKFSGNLQYQLRYVRNLTPIILDDLSNYGTDITIGGMSEATAGILPEETHQEILERAVTLAKIAWAGGSEGTAAAQQNRASGQ